MFTKEISSTYEKNLKNEWLITNGIGGYASSTIVGVNTRKYHGLLVAALGNNLDRFLVLSKVNEYVEIEDNKYSLSTNECRDYVEKGYLYQEAFEKDFLPEFLYDVEGVKIVKKLAMVYGENKLAIKYNIVNTTSKTACFKLLPLVNFRSYHAVQYAREYGQSYENDVLNVDLGAYDNQDYKLFIKVTDSNYRRYQNTFYDNMYYRVEESRGFEATERQYIPGEFGIIIEPDSQKEIFLVAEVSNKFSVEDKFLKSLVRAEEVRLEKVCKIASAKNDISKELAISADNFIITKNGERTIIAGYPWFNDWGRDTFISLEGLTLKTNRFSDAKSILKYFAKYIKDGLVPNYIQDGGGQAYNTVDASLWYIEALNQYVEYTKDKETLKELFSKVIEIIMAYKNGTLFDIKMQDDGLISAGNERTQLTWMDAKCGDYIPTPRFGKAVEINALWYNALKIAESLFKILREDILKIEKDETKFANSNNEVSEDSINEFVLSKLDANIDYHEFLDVINGSLAKKVKDSFKKFYNDDGLFDTIEPFNSQIRPNQIIAMSLTFPVLTGDKAVEVMNLVKEKLLTDKGLKTLNAEDEQYRGRYCGDGFARDSAYHQGTVWTWLLGEYAKAYYNVFKKRYVFNKIDELLNDGCIGSIAEIYDADEPREANGALAQAWGVSAMMYLKPIYSNK